MRLETRLLLQSGCYRLPLLLLLLAAILPYRFDAESCARP